MKIVSFLGFNKYDQTTYLHPNYPENEQKLSTPFFQEALVEFYQPTTLYTLLTNKVETQIPRGADKTNWQALQERLANKVDLQPIRNIPERNTPDDIWCIFDKITNCLQEKDCVIFDITHSFRSIPVVALLAASYLRVVRQVNIKGLLYGAFEAKNEWNETPSFDLLPIVSLLEWTTATDQFLKTGNGETLAHLLSHSNALHEHPKNLAENIHKISQGLRILRPLDVMQQAAQLPISIQNAAPTIYQDVPPFALLLKRVEADYSKFGLESSGLENPQEFKERAKSSLINLLKIVEWYIDKEQIVQALSLAREWLPTLLCYYFEVDAFAEKNREEMELLLRGGKYKDPVTKETIKESKYLPQWNQISETKRKALPKIWTGQPSLTSLRNDVLHSSFRKNPRSAEDIINQTKLIYKELEKIAEQWLGSD